MSLSNLVGLLKNGLVFECGSECESCESGLCAKHWSAVAENSIASSGIGTTTMNQEAVGFGCRFPI